VCDCHNKNRKPLTAGSEAAFDFGKTGKGGLCAGLFLCPCLAVKDRLTSSVSLTSVWENIMFRFITASIQQPFQLLRFWPLLNISCITVHGQPLRSLYARTRKQNVAASAFSPDCQTWQRPAVVNVLCNTDESASDRDRHSVK